MWSRADRHGGFDGWQMDRERSAGVLSRLLRRPARRRNAPVARLLPLPSGYKPARLVDRLAAAGRARARLEKGSVANCGGVTMILIVNADDFGMTPGVNRGIISAHESGIVTSTSLMVRGAAAAEAVELAREHPQLSVGLHVDLCEWVYRD